MKLITKNNTMTIAVVSATAIAIYAFYLPVPKGEIEYSDYAYRNQFFVSLSVISTLLSYFVKAQTKIIRTCLILQIGLFSIVCFKSFIRTVDEHYSYDDSIFGAFVIYGVIYLISPYVLPASIYIKNQINQYWMKWPTKHRNQKNRGL